MRRRFHNPGATIVRDPRGHKYARGDRTDRRGVFPTSYRDPIAVNIQRELQRREHLSRAQKPGRTLSS